AEVDVHEPVTGELDEEVLAGRLRADEHLAGEQGRGGGEAALGAAGPGRAAGESRRQLAGEAEEGVPLRHRVAFPAPGPTPATAVARPSARTTPACRSAVRAARRR